MVGSGHSLRIIRSNLNFIESAGTANVLSIAVIDRAGSFINRVHHLRRFSICHERNLILYVHYYVATK